MIMAKTTIWGSGLPAGAARTVLGLVCAMAACSACTPACADIRYRCECQVVETTYLEHFGRQGQRAELSNFTCRIIGGPLNGFVVNGTNLWESAGKARGALLGSMAVAQGASSSVVYQSYDVKRRLRRGKDDAVRWEASSWGLYRTASGSVAFLAGKTFRSIARATGPGTFTIDNTINDGD